MFDYTDRKTGKPFQPEEEKKPWKCPTCGCRHVVDGRCRHCGGDATRARVLKKAK